jgi:hypothetical protein
MRSSLLLILILMHSGCGRAGEAASASPARVSDSSGTASPAASTWAPEATLVKNLKAHVTMLAGTIGQRNTKNPEGYQRAADYLESVLTQLGYQVHRQTYLADGHESVNLWTERPGTDQVLVIGAHYDSLDSGTPGADDNASGCAATLELARLLKDSKLGPTVRFVLFANEEPPYFQTDLMGSLVYAKSRQQAKESIMGMISLESIGFYSDQPESQHFPAGVSGYPSTGNFVAFISDLSSKAFMERCLSGFQQAGTLAAEGLAAPGMIEGVMWSDHWAFAKCGYPALMITDTAPFRNPHYHLSSDTPDTLDYDKLAAVTEGTRRLVENITESAPRPGKTAPER